jgi:NAD(P)-dependent dehydrogenase (short-subunit alcohol dehydrogenase family)
MIIILISHSDDYNICIVPVGNLDGLNVLVNNAGCNWAEPFDKFPKQAFQKVMTLNLESIFFLSQQLLNLLQKASRPGDPARIINVGSINGILPPTFHTFAYSSSKAALHMLTKHMALTLAPNVTVNAIAPGSFESKMMKETLETFGDAIKEVNPMGRIGKREDMAAVCIWLSSAGGTYVNGAVIVVDGGAVIQQAPMAKV